MPRIEVTPLAPEARAEILEAEILALSAACVMLEKLMKRRALMADRAWSYLPPGPEDTAGRLRERAFALMATPTPVPWLDDLTILLEPGDELSRVLSVTGLYEPETMVALRRLLPKGGTFVDVGAHCGIFTLFAAHCVGPSGLVVSFEPSLREFMRLNANIALNHLDQVEVHPVAVTDNPGVIRLRIAEASHAGHNTLAARFAYDSVQLDRVIDVDATTLDSALKDLARCDVIKLDIEGSELRALTGAVRSIARLRPALVLEVFDVALAGLGASVAELMAWLTDHGYVPYDIDLATGNLLPAVTSWASGISKNMIALPANETAKY